MFGDDDMLLVAVANFGKILYYKTLTINVLLALIISLKILGWIPLN